MAKVKHRWPEFWRDHPLLLIVIAIAVILLLAQLPSTPSRNDDRVQQGIAEIARLEIYPGICHPNWPMYRVPQGEEYSVFNYATDLGYYWMYSTKEQTEAREQEKARIRDSVRGNPDLTKQFCSDYERHVNDLLFKQHWDEKGPFLPNRLRGR